MIASFEVFSKTPWLYIVLASIALLISSSETRILLNLLLNRRFILMLIQQIL